MTRRIRLGRVRAAVAGAATAEVTPPKKVWRPAEPGGDPPGRYPQPGGRMIIVLYPSDGPAATEERT